MAFADDETSKEVTRALRSLAEKPKGSSMTIDDYFEKAEAKLIKSGQHLFEIYATLKDGTTVKVDRVDVRTVFPGIQEELRFKFQATKFDSDGNIIHTGGLVKETSKYARRVVKSRVVRIDDESE